MIRICIVLQRTYAVYDSLANGYEVKVISNSTSGNNVEMNMHIGLNKGNEKAFVIKTYFSQAINSKTFKDGMENVGVSSVHEFSMYFPVSKVRKLDFKYTCTYIRINEVNGTVRTSQ